MISYQEVSAFYRADFDRRRSLLPATSSFHRVIKLLLAANNLSHL